jgi:hypothetical protein
LFGKKTFIVGDIGEFGSFFLISFFFFGDDGHFGDITKLAIADTQKKNKERKKGKKPGGLLLLLNWCVHSQCCLHRGVVT